MITPSSHTSPGLPSLASFTPRRAADPAAPAPIVESLSTTRHVQLQAAIARSPEIRPEVVARGEGLAVTPAYPARYIIEQVAQRITNGPDGTQA